MDTDGHAHLSMGIDVQNPGFCKIISCSFSFQSSASSSVCFVVLAEPPPPPPPALIQWALIQWAMICKIQFFVKLLAEVVAFNPRPVPRFVLTLVGILDQMLDNFKSIT